MFIEGKTLISEYAYDVEAQALLVAEAQKSGNLEVLSSAITTWKIIEEWNQSWAILNRETVLYTGHCNREIYKQITEGTKCLLIQTPSSHNEFTFGYFKRAVASVLLENGRLYSSPLFDYSWYY